MPPFQSEIKSRAAIRLGFRPNRPAVPLHHALNGGQADAGSRELGGGVQALESAKKLGGVGGIEACAVVANEESGMAIGGGPAEFDACGRPLGSKFPGIFGEVGKSEMQERRIGVRLEVWLDGDVHVALRSAGAEVRSDGSGE